MTSRWARVAQGAAIASFATFVAALSHTVGGGTPPGLLAVVLSMAFSTLLCLTVAGGRLTLARTVIAVAATQFALHALYSVQGAAPSAHRRARRAITMAQSTCRRPRARRCRTTLRC